MANNKKRVIITPYRCKLNGTTCTTENLKEKELGNALEEFFIDIKNNRPLVKSICSMDYLVD